MAPRKTQDWNPTVHEDILVAFLKVGAFNSTNTAEAMELLKQKYTFTESALKYVFIHAPFCSV